MFRFIRDELARIVDALRAILSAVEKIVALLQPKITYSVVLAITDRGLKLTVNYPIEGATKIMSAPILDDSLGYQYALSITGKDTDGNPAPAPVLSSPPQWTETELDPSGLVVLPPGTLATLTVAPDGMSATAVPTGKGLGTVNIGVLIPAQGSFPNATATDSFGIGADVATSIAPTLTATPIVAPATSAKAPAKP